MISMIFMWSLNFGSLDDCCQGPCSLCAVPMLLSTFQFLCPLSCTWPAWGEDESKGPTMKRELTIERLEKWNDHWTCQWVVNLVAWIWMVWGLRSFTIPLEPHRDCGDSMVGMGQGGSQKSEKGWLFQDILYDTMYLYSYTSYTLKILNRFW